MVNKEPAMTTPPLIMEDLRPQLSVKICVKIVNTTFSRPDTPEARNDAVVEERPACLKSTGA